MQIREYFLPRGNTLTFEVLGKEAAWTQFARIKIIPGGEKTLSDSIGERQMVGPMTGDVKVTFKPYSRSGDGTVRESDIKPAPAPPSAETLYIEDGGGTDYNDYTVRVTLAQAAKSDVERVEAMVSSKEAVNLTK
jgi:hypothetical protein